MVFDDPFNKFTKPGLTDPGLEDPGLDPGGGLPGGGGLPPGGGGTPPVDTIGPSILNFNISPSSLSIAYGSYATVTISAEVRDLESGILSVSLNSSNMPLSSGDTYQTTRTFLYNSAYAGTTRTEAYTIIASDGAGNLSSSMKSVSVYYGTVPDTTRPTIHSFSTNYSSFTLNNSSTSATVSLTLQATDTGGISSVSVNNGSSQVYQSGDYWYFNKTLSYLSNLFARN